MYITLRNLTATSPGKDAAKADEVKELMLEVRLWASQRAQRLEQKMSFAKCMLVIRWWRWWRWW